MDSIYLLLLSLDKLHQNKVKISEDFNNNLLFNTFNRKVVKLLILISYSNY